MYLVVAAFQTDAASGSFQRAKDTRVSLYTDLFSCSLCLTAIFAPKNSSSAAP